MSHAFERWFNNNNTYQNIVIAIAVDDLMVTGLQDCPSIRDAIIRTLLHVSREQLVMKST